jgi:hypothetical protein
MVGASRGSGIEFRGPVPAQNFPLQSELSSRLYHRLLVSQGRAARARSWLGGTPARVPEPRGHSPSSSFCSHCARRQGHLGLAAAALRGHRPLPYSAGSLPSTGSNVSGLRARAGERVGGLGTKGTGGAGIARPFPLQAGSPVLVGFSVCVGGGDSVSVITVQNGLCTVSV